MELGDPSPCDTSPEDGAELKGQFERVETVDSQVILVSLTAVCILAEVANTASTQPCVLNHTVWGCSSVGCYLGVRPSRLVFTAGCQLSEVQNDSLLRYTVLI